MTYIVALCCVVGIAVGQILFKWGAISLNRSNSFFDVQTASILFSALTLYGITTIAWVWVLQKASLGRIYPLMALAFILVPIGSHFLFGEEFKTQYFIGISFIATGIVVAFYS